jgi:hypothetical protein
MAWGIPLVLLTSFVTGALIFLQIRRRPASQRQWNRPLWGMMGLIVGCMVVVSQWLPRPLDISRADLKGKWLVEVNLGYAYAHLANFEGANLSKAKCPRPI